MLKSVSQTLEACLGLSYSHPGLLFSRVAEHTRWLSISQQCFSEKGRDVLFFWVPFIREAVTSLLNLPGQKQAARSYPHSKKLSKSRKCIFSLYSWGVLHQQGRVTNVTGHCVMSHISYRRFIRWERQSAHCDKWALGEVWPGEPLGSL